MKNNNKKGFGIASMVVGVVGTSLSLIFVVTGINPILSLILGVIGFFLAIFSKHCGQKTVGFILNIVSILISIIVFPILFKIRIEIKEAAKERQAELIYTGIQFAYTSYLYDNLAQLPEDINDIMKYYSLENTRNFGNKIYADDGLICKVTKNSIGINVNCGEYLNKTIKIY
ncbi:MAG: hypothetical protein Q4E75_02485 [bacterium]|nr:hypothetical protein [bacterium]